MGSEGARIDIVPFLHLVQHSIHDCLRLYMSQEEAVHELKSRADIKPCFTNLVWQSLEEENQEFFRAYNERLILKGQILRYNELLKKQDQLTNQLLNLRTTSFTPHTHTKLTGVAPNPNINDSDQHHFQVADNMPSHAGWMNFPTDISLVQSSHGGTEQGFNNRNITNIGVCEDNSNMLSVADMVFPEIDFSVIESLDLTSFVEGTSIVEERHASGGKNG